MAELLFCRYVPMEVSIINSRERKITDYYKLQGCRVKKISYNLCMITKPPKLEMIFREGERDYIYNMIDDVRHYYKKKRILNRDICDFIAKIESGEIKIRIFLDQTYTLF